MGRTTRRIRRLFKPRKNLQAPASIGFLDLVREEGDGIRVAGWLLLEDGNPFIIEFEAAGGGIFPAERGGRPDVAEAYPQIPGAEHSGYTAILPAGTLAHDGNYEFTIKARRGTRIVFSCRVVRLSRDSGLSSSEEPSSTGQGFVYL